MPKATGLEMQRMLSKYGSAAKGSGKIFTDVIDKADDLRVSKRLFSALNSDLNQAAKAGTESGLALKDARDNYARLSKPIRQLEESALYRLFNGKVPKSNDELAAAVMTMKPDKLKGVMQILSKSDPALKARLQRFWVEQHIQKAMVTGEATVPRFNPVRMLKMRDTPQYNVIFNTPSERKAVETGIKLSQRIIMNNFNESGRVFERTKLAAGVLASRDKTFVARLAADLFAPKAIAKYVQSKQGIQVLTEMAKAKNTNAIAGAMEKLHYINQQDAE